MTKSLITTMRIVIADKAKRLRHCGLRAATQSHDSQSYCAIAGEILNQVQDAMTAIEETTKKTKN